jgi:DNA-binding MarR family transcriptional regulator
MTARQSIETSTALIQLARTYHVAIAEFEQATGVHLARWRILYFVSEHPNCTQKFLTQANRVDPASITRAVKQLEEEGLIERRPDADDNRLTRVTITKAGRQRVAAVAARRKVFLRRALAGFNPAELEVFQRALERIEANLTTAEDAASFQPLRAAAAD